MRAASLCPTAVLKKQQTSDMNKQEHMANCSVTLSCASYETIFCVAVSLELSLAHPFSVHYQMAKEAGASTNCSREIQMLVFTCGLM